MNNHQLERQAELLNNYHVLEEEYNQLDQEDRTTLNELDQIKHTLRLLKLKDTMFQIKWEIEELNQQ